MKRSLITLILIVSTILTPVVSRLQAAESQFHITQSVFTSDTEAPTTPTNLTATAVSSSQINLSWTASTDNIQVTGYRVFRDLVNIATTTSTTYQDAGLTPSTSYDYTITAIDAAYNESAHTATSSATTFPVTTGGNGGGGNGGGSSSNGGGSIELRLLYFIVEPETTNATIRFGTNLEVLSSVSWGLTPDYELGTLSSALYLKDHSVKLEELRPNTKYYFKVKLLDGYGRVRTIDNQEFTTLGIPNILPPENVSNLKATPDTKVITLTWQNPNTNFDSVRIVKSDKFYPRDPSEGQVIYEGTGEQFVDQDVVKDTTYYYTAFTKDANGNYSSGAVADAKLLNAGETAKTRDLFGGILTLPKELINPIINGLSLLDIDFIQDGKKLPVVSDTVNIKGDRTLTISIDYDKVPEILKTIAITLYDPVDSEKSFSFLLRVNKDKTAYQAVVGALERPGNYRFGIAILDLKNQGLKKLAGVLVATVPELAWDKGNNLFDTFTNNPIYSFSLILLLLLLLVAFLLSRNLRKKTRNQKQMNQMNVPQTGNLSVMPAVDQFKK